MSETFFTSFDVPKCIKQLKRNGSAVQVWINYPLNCIWLLSFIRFPLSVMFNLSIQTGELPDIWKVASVTPIFEKGPPSNSANYRPIVLICVGCKLLETGININLLNHLLFPFGSITNLAMLISLLVQTKKTTNIFISNQTVFNLHIL